MVGTLVRLQWKLTIRQLRDSTAALVLTILAGLSLLGTGLGGAFGLGFLREAPDLRAPITILLFAVVTLAWPALSLLSFGGSDALDVRSFALYPLRGRELVPGMLAAAVVGFGLPFTLLWDIGFVTAWSDAPGTVALALVGALLGIATCVLAQRCVSQAVSGLMRRRRVRESMVIIGFLLFMAFVVGIQLINLRTTSDDADTGSFSQFVASLDGAARVVGWTPFGWPWAAPASAAAGHWGAAVVQLGLSVVLVAALGWIWAGQVSRGLVSPLESAGRGERVRAGGLLDRVLPHTPIGAIARRDIRMFRRDPRHFMNIFSTLLMPFYFVIVALVGSQTGGSGLSGDGGRAFLMFIPAALAWAVSSVSTSDICYDGSALGIQVLTGATGRDDRWGRALALGIVFGVLQVIVLLVFVAWSQRWELLPGSIGLCAALFLGGLGAGSWAGALWQYPLPPSYDNIFRRGARASTGSLVGSLLSMLVQILVALPTLGLVIAGVFVPWLEWLALLVGIGSGLGLLFWGVNRGGRRLDATWPEVVATVTWKG